MKRTRKMQRTLWYRGLILLTAVLMAVLPLGQALADIPGRVLPRGTVPNPGTQEQELANITFPAPYNVFEFVVTCAACHGGTIDQNVGHFGNWAGTSMGSAARDPIFRANQIGVNRIVKDLTGTDGAGNMCFRCHSPNGWLSGRFDPQLSGKADGSSIIHSPLLSTDDEGIMCETCHRVIGNVTQKRADLNPNEPVWNMLAFVDDWPHQGNPYPDGPVAGLPYGDATLQFNDGMTYAGKYSGSVNIHFSDVPLTGDYTGQTYAVYPPDWPTTPGQPYVSPDGNLPIHFEEPIGPPIVGGVPDNQLMGLSLEHPTTKVDFLRTPEFCGSCHDLTIPILNHGMPEQRTYSEWRYSDYGKDKNATSYLRCQDCHMPSHMHEYSDDVPVGLNPDPTVAGWFPYGKDRNSQGGTTFHKLVGANRDLPEMMKLLYPEVDLEVIGAETGNDTRVFPGMLSDRSTMWNRAKRNTEVSLQGAVQVEIAQAPTETSPGSGVYEMQVRVTNNTGHRIPSGYPDGRRFWISVGVTDPGNGNATVYESGVYDQTQATLYTDGTKTGFNRALSNTVDAATGDNAVVVYEKLTSSRNGGGVMQPPTPSLLNDTVIFDNRIPPSGWEYDNYLAAGVKFITYDAVSYEPSLTPARFTEGENYDLVTYRFNGPAGGTLNARAELYWQTHTREHMEFLKAQDTSQVAPEGPPSIYSPNYPNTPNYLWDHIPAAYKTDLGGAPLNNNWGGVAYAAWLATGKGEPMLVQAADTTVAAAPDAPTGVTTNVFDPFTIQVSWNPVAGADGYIVWTRYGLSDATASWDKLGVVYTGDPLNLRHEALNVAKTYGYRVQAFNGAGESPMSGVITAQTPIDLPLPPENLQFLNSTVNSITLTWYDASDNETGFIVERQDVPPFAGWYEVARVPTANEGGFGGQAWTDRTVNPGSTYNYRVSSYNAFGASVPTLPVQGSTLGVPGGTLVLSATVAPGQNELSWTTATGTLEGYRLTRYTQDPTVGGVVVTPDQTRVLPPDSTTFADNLIQPDTDYWYQVTAFNNTGETQPSNVAYVHSLPFAAAAPTGLNAVVTGITQIDLTWTDNADNEAGFSIERSDGGANTFVEIATVGPNITGYTNTGLNETATYDYRVRAYVAGPQYSAYSNIASATTPASGTVIPVPAFSGTPLTGNSPLTVVFTNDTTFVGGTMPPETTWLWNFGDGATSTNQAPSHLYGTPGTYTVSLTVTVTGAANTFTRVDYVTVEPGGAIRTSIVPTIPAGAQWRVDGGGWLDSGQTQFGVSTGVSHIVSFQDVPGYTTPIPQSVTVNHGLTTDVFGTYTEKLGSIKVNLAPDIPTGNISAARWRLDGGAWQASGQTVPNVLAHANHTVDFLAIADWQEPAPMTGVSVVENTLTQFSATYVGVSGSLQTVIGPPSVPGTAQWQVDGGAPQNSGQTVTGLTLGGHTVAFTTVAGWTKPADQAVTVQVGQTTMAYGNYSGADGAVVVNYQPLTGVASQPQWALNGGGWNNSGTVIWNLTPGVSQTVTFKVPAGYVTPSPIVFNPVAGTVTSLTPVFTPVAGAGGSDSLLLLENNESPAAGKAAR